jgi:hypothetical protein
MPDESRQLASEKDPKFWTRPVERWMLDASHHIDNEVGLARFDLAVAVTARIIAKYHDESAAATQKTAGDRSAPPPHARDL